MSWAASTHWLRVGLYLVEPDNLGQVTVTVKNCSPNFLELQRNDFIGSLENVQGCETRAINPAYLQAVATEQSAKSPAQKLTLAKRQFLEQNVKLQVQEEYREKYLKIILNNHKAVSQDKFDLGCTDTPMHEIPLETAEPVYVKQF
jgi:hypothetical protein